MIGGGHRDGVGGGSGGVVGGAAPTADAVAAAWVGGHGDGLSGSVLPGGAAAGIGRAGGRRTARAGVSACQSVTIFGKVCRYRFCCCHTKLACCAGAVTGTVTPPS